MQALEMVKESDVEALMRNSLLPWQYDDGQQRELQA
jgi:hypothetical protein